MENNAIQIFNYKEQQVRTVDIDGEAWFVAKDVCDILGLKNITNALKSLDKDELTFKLLKSGGEKREMKLVNESGIYNLIFRSYKPVAKQFRHWVTHDVLPSIRKHGAYIANAQIEALISQNKALQEINAKLMRHIEATQSFTMLGQAITPIKGTLSVGEAAKVFAQHGVKIGQNRCFRILRDMHVLAKRKGRQHNQPTQAAIEKGLCVLVVNLGSKGTPYLTMKGMQHLASVLAKKQFPLLALITGSEIANA